MDAILKAVVGQADVLPSVTALLLDVAAKGLLLLGVAWVLVLSLRNASAAARHLVWSVAVVGLLFLPVASLVAPKWNVPGMQMISFEREVAGADVGVAAVAAVAGEAEEVGAERTIAVAEAPPAEPRASEPRPADRDARSSRAVAASAEGSGFRATRSISNSTQVAAAAVVAPPAAEATFANIDWFAALSVVWLAGVLLLLAWIAGGLFRTWLMVRSAREVTDGPVAWLFDDLSDELDLTGRVTLLQTLGATMPMALGIRSRILLPAEADDWTDARLRAVLLHELAHVKRHDYVTQLVARLVGALHWFNPLVWVAIHRMRVERELACDDQVLSTGSRASDYAGHLLEIARGANGRVFASFGGVAMARRSRLSDRLLAVLDETRRRADVTPKMTVAAWMGAACFLFPVAGAGLGASADAGVEPANQTDIGLSVPAAAPTPLPSVPPVPVPSSDGLAQARCDWYDREAETSHWMSGEDDEYQIRLTMDDCRLELEIAGEIFFNDAETDIVDISRRGYFEMEERAGRSRRRMVIEPAGSGELERSWFIDGDERPYDSEASAWLSDMIPLLFRRVGLQAEERAGRILESDGVDGVLQEISYIPSDYVARKYYQVVLTEADLDTGQLRSVVRQAGNELESDYELAQLLIEVAENHPVDESVMTVYVEAAGSLESDYEQRRVLDTILSRQDLSPDVAEAMLRLATDLESDYELAELLIAILDRQPVDEVLTQEFFDAVHTLDSDYEHNRVLKVALHEGAPNLDVLNLSLESATHIDSDYERAELLLEVAELYPVGETMPASYLEAARSLDSDYELGRVLKFLIEYQRLNEDALGIVLDAALTLDSDYELANLLLEVVDRYDLNEREKAAYFEAVGSIESDYELGRVLKAIIEQGPLTEQNLSDVLATATEFESEYEMANLLIMVAENHDLEGDLRTMFMRAADDISSDYERGRVLSALNPRRGRIQ